MSAAAAMGSPIALERRQELVVGEAHTHNNFGAERGRQRQSSLHGVSVNNENLSVSLLKLYFRCTLVYSLGLLLAEPQILVVAERHHNHWGSRKL